MASSCVTSSLISPLRITPDLPPFLVRCLTCSTRRSSTGVPRQACSGAACASCALLGRTSACPSRAAALTVRHRLLRACRGCSRSLLTALRLRRARHPLPEQDFGAQVCEDVGRPIRARRGRRACASCDKQVAREGPGGNDRGRRETLRLIPLRLHQYHSPLSCLSLRCNVLYAASPRALERGLWRD